MDVMMFATFVSWEEDDNCASLNLVNDSANNNYESNYYKFAFIT